MNPEVPPAAPPAVAPVPAPAIQPAPPPVSAEERAAEAPSTANTMPNAAAGSVAPNDVASAERLTLADVIASSFQAYPEILRARQLRAETGGDLLASYGAYDLKLYGHTLSEPTGYYDNYRNGLGVARQTWWGGYLAAGYRIGRGDFQPWYKERQTNKGGEFKVGVGLPLLQGRAIDPQRLAVFQASLAQQAAEPAIQQTVLETARDAAYSYWQWVAVGAIWQAQRELLDLAEVRNQQYEVGVQAGKFAEIDLLLNQQLVAERRGKVLETEQKFRATAFKLGLYLRDEQGQPIVPRDEWLPLRFPVIQLPEGMNFQQDLQDALARRPEPRLLRLEWRGYQLDQQLACNQLLPQVDLVTEASQDVGDPANSPDDKGPFELLVGLEGEVPLQRRKARGKIQSTSAKMAQVSEKLRLVQDKIAAELMTAHNALQLSSQIVQQSELSLRAALETLERYRFAFNRGKIDLIYLNLLETKANETEIKLVEAQSNWFAVLAQFQYILALDPLDQAMLIDELPLSTRPGPGNLPPAAEPNAAAFEKDWQRHSTPPQPQP